MIRLIAGFCIGVMISRNAQQYATPYWGAIILGAILGAVLFYFFGKRDKNIAVATAVATAVASANAAADAKAQAIANAAVHIYQMSGQIPSQKEIDTVTSFVHGEIQNDDSRAITGDLHVDQALAQSST